MVRRQQTVGEMKTRARAALLDEPASAEGGTKESRAVPLSLACPKTLLWRFTRALLRARPTHYISSLVRICDLIELDQGRNERCSTHTF
jgi:hypothetical protein